MRRYLLLLLLAVALVACREAPPSPAVRQQLTFVGNAAYPAISNDGRQLAYAVTRCAAVGCSYAIEVRDLASNVIREITSGIAQLYYIRWSPNSRNLLYAGIAHDGWASYLVPATGGTPRRVAVQNALFIDSGEILWAPDQDGGDWHSIEIGDDEGNPHARIRVPGQADGFGVVCSVPASPWIIAALYHGSDAELRAVDRNGRVAGSFTVRGVGAGFTTASRDAVWIQVPAGDAASILRVPFNPATGQFSPKGDVVYTGDSGGSPTIFSVTPAGDRLFVAEASTTVDASALSLDEAMHSGSGTHPSILHSTGVPLVLRVSPDGSRLLRHNGSSHQWTISAFSGQGETAIEPAAGATIEDAFWNTDSQIRLKESAPDGLRFAILDTKTGRRSAVLSLPATAVSDFALLPDGSWAWISTWGTTVSLQRPGEAAARILPLHGIAATLSMDATPDGSRLAILGWLEPAATGAIGVRVISLKPGDAASTWWSSTHHDDPARVLWTRGNALLLALYEAPKATAVFRLTGSGDPQKLGVIPEDLADLSVSRDLSRVAVIRSSFHGDIWLRDAHPLPPQSSR
jgi:WD40-like Beta Propeller Repeat